MNGKSLKRQMSTSRRHEKGYNGGTNRGCMKKPAKVPSVVVWTLADICDSKIKTISKAVVTDTLRGQTFIPLYSSQYCIVLCHVMYT
jgi:hypothetical protein